MARARSVYRCTECGHEHPKWAGRCEGCGAWNTVAEEPDASVRDGRRAQGRCSGRGADAASSRRSGCATSSATPLAALAHRPRRVRLRARRRHRARLDDAHRRRAGHRQVHAAAAGGGAARGGRAAPCSTPAARSRPSSSGCAPTGWARAPARCTPSARRARGDPRRRRGDRADVLVLDSIQTVSTESLESAPGNVGQVRECAGLLMRFAKETGTAVIVVGHVTKGGGIAGPKTLEHIVDTVLYFEGETTLDYRLLRATKNRFGSVDELGVFSMTGARPRAGRESLGALPRRARRHVSGSAVTALMEGTRPVLVEVQALAARAGYGTPQRVATGFDPQAPRGAARGARAARRHLVRRPRRLRAGHRRRAARRTGRRPRGRGGAALEPRQPARCPPTRSSSARSGWAARSARSPASSGASPRRRASASRGCSARRRRASATAGA